MTISDDDVVSWLLRYTNYTNYQLECIFLFTVDTFSITVGCIQCQQLVLQWPKISFVNRTCRHIVICITFNNAMQL